MTIEQVKEQVKKLHNKDITDQQAQAILDKHPGGELSESELGAVSGGAAGGTSWWYEFHCWSCQWDGTAQTLAQAQAKHSRECPGCAKAQIIQAPEPIPEWLANPSADELKRWTE